MKKLIYVLIALCLSITTKAQQFVRKGNNFVQTDSSTRKSVEPTKTQYTYEIKGEKYPIYRSKNGKYFIIMTSKKTKKQYRKYLPDVKKELEE